MKKEYLSHRDAGNFCRSLGMLLHAGIGLADGMFLLAKEETEEHKQLLEAMGQRLDEGAALSEVMRESGVFAAYVTGMIRVGESTGRLEDSLNALADHFEEQYRRQQKLRSAIAYPSAIAALMLVVIGVLLIKVLPVFDGVYASLGSRLTGVAGGLLYFGQLLKAALPVLLAVLAVIVTAVLVITLCPALRRRCTVWLKRRFGDRGVLGKFNNARFARALAMGLGSGLQLEEAMELASQLLTDVPGAANRCKLCAEALTNGEPLADALGRADLLDASRSRMLAIGLRSGQGELVMHEIAQQLADEAAQTLDDAISRVEPAMVLTASVLVGLILLAVMLPLMNILSAVG